MCEFTRAGVTDIVTREGGGRYETHGGRDKRRRDGIPQKGKPEASLSADNRKMLSGHFLMAWKCQFHYLILSFK